MVTTKDTKDPNLCASIGYPAIPPACQTMCKNMKPQRSTAGAKVEGSTQDKVLGLDWKSIESELQDHGCAGLGLLLSKSECSDLIATYDSESAFRSRVIMARHGFGKGE